MTTVDDRSWALLLEKIDGIATGQQSLEAAFTQHRLDHATAAGIAQGRTQMFGIGARAVGIIITVTSLISPVLYLVAESLYSTATGQKL